MSGGGCWKFRTATTKPDVSGAARPRSGDGWPIRRGRQARRDPQSPHPGPDRRSRSRWSRIGTGGSGTGAGDRFHVQVSGGVTVPGMKVSAARGFLRAGMAPAAFGAGWSASYPVWYRHIVPASAEGGTSAARKTAVVLATAVGSIRLRSDCPMLNQWRPGHTGLVLGSWWEWRKANRRQPASTAGCDTVEEPRNSSLGVASLSMGPM